MGWASSIAVVQHIHLKSLSGCFRAKRLGAAFAVDPHPLCKGDVNALPVCHSARAGAVTGPQVASVSKVDFLPSFEAGETCAELYKEGASPVRVGPGLTPLAFIWLLPKHGFSSFALASCKPPVARPRFSSLTYRSNRLVPERHTATGAAGGAPRR